MATNKQPDKQVVMTLLKKQLALQVDELPPVPKKTLELDYEPIDRMGTLLIASFQQLADELVHDTQICKCGNEIHFQKYAVYPNARVDLPENFGKPYILEQVWQFKPEQEGQDA